MEVILEFSTYFFIYSFLGWVLESVFKSISERKFVNSGFLFGPLCPIYGFGAIIMYIFLNGVSKNPFLTFGLGFIVLSVWEYLVGYFLEKVFHTKYWDYSNNKFNIQGRVCLLNSMYWGVLGLLFIDVIHPFVTNLLAQINSDIRLYCTIAAYVLLLIDMIISITSNFSIVEGLKRVEELNNSIKEKIEEIKAKGKEFEIKGATLQTALDELNAKREALAQKSYKTIIRLKRAFPTMNSEAITKFLNNKEKKEEKQ